MNWPWVSRLAYDLLLNERDRLREQQDVLLTHTRIIERRAAGLPENPREQAVDTEDLPDAVVKLISRYDSEGMRFALENDARVARKGGKSWDEIEQLLRDDDDNG